MASETNRDREMILNPYEWPLFYLPLKRHVPGSRPDVAILRSATRNPDGIFKVDKNMTVYGAVGEVETLTYKGVDAILADGWVVD